MMFTMPVYDMMLLPGVTFYFKNDIFQQMGSQDAKTGDDVLFLMQRSDKDRKDLTAEDFYPVGISGKLDSQDSEGNIRIRTLARVDVSDLEMTEDGVLANASIRPETEDISAEEEKQWMIPPVVPAWYCLIILYVSCAASLLWIFTGSFTSFAI